MAKCKRKCMLIYKQNPDTTPYCTAIWFLFHHKVQCFIYNCGRCVLLILQSSSWEYCVPLWLNMYKNCFALLLEHGNGEPGKSKLAFPWIAAVWKAATSNCWNQPAPFLYAEKGFKRTVWSAHLCWRHIPLEGQRQHAKLRISSLYNTVLGKHLEWPRQLKQHGWVSILPGLGWITRWLRLSYFLIPEKMLCTI